MLFFSPSLDEKSDGPVGPQGDVGEDGLRGMSYIISMI